MTYSRFFARMFGLLLVVALGLMVIAPAAAQSLTPIAIGENKPGEVTTTTPTVSYALTVNSPQTVTVQALGLTPGFAPTFRVLSLGGVTLQTVVPAPGATVAQGSLALPTPGVYQIAVSSANGQPGQFVLSVQGGAPLPPATPLVLGQPQAGVVTAQAPISLFTFTALPTDGVIVTVHAMNPAQNAIAAGPRIELRDQETSETLASSGPRLIGLSAHLPSGTQTYLLQVSHSGSDQSEPFTVCLDSQAGLIRCPGGSTPLVTPTAAAIAPTATPVPPTRVPPVQIPPGAPCSVASSVGTPVNVRSGPNTSFPVVAQLPVNATAAVIGRLPDSSWYQVNLNGVIGWISGSVVVIGGQCATIPAVTPTPVATTTTTTATVIPAASSTPTPTLTLTPPEPVATLNFSLPPVFGSTALTSGFVPDPFQVGMTAGGPANVSYLGGGCSGFATSAPSFSVNYTSGAFPTLRFYFVGGADTTMVINSPSGSFFCVDDSFGTLNPTIDFNTPSSGRYDVWIGTFSAGGSVGGTLSVTENTGNHP